MTETKKSKKSEIAEIMLRDTIDALRAADRAETDTAIAARSQMDATLQLYNKRRKKIDDMKMKIGVLTRQMLDAENEAHRELMRGHEVANQILVQMIEDGESSETTLVALTAPDAQT
jgi:hypothetical protein